MNWDSPQVSYEICKRLDGHALVNASQLSTSWGDMATFVIGWRSLVPDEEWAWGLVKARFRDPDLSAWLAHIRRHWGLFRERRRRAARKYVIARICTERGVDNTFPHHARRLIERDIGLICGKESMRLLRPMLPT